MTENRQVSTIAFLVFVLGMLGFFVALAFDVFSSNSTAITAPPTPTPHLEMENKVIPDDRPFGTMNDLLFRLAEQGKVLPEEKAQGVEHTAWLCNTFQYPNELYSHDILCSSVCFGG